MDVKLLLANEIIVVLIDAIGILLAFWVYLSGKESKPNRIFFAMTSFLILWINFDFIYGFSIFLFPSLDFLRISLWGQKLVFAVLAPAFIFLYYFSIYFPKEGKRRYLLDKIYVPAWLALFILSFTPLVIKSTELKDGNMSATGDWGLIVYFIVSAVSSILVLINLFSKFNFLQKEEKLQLQYFLIGLSIFIIFNIIFNIGIPLYHGGNYRSYSYILGDYSIIFLFGFTAYAIIKKGLFGIRVVLTQLLVAIMGLVLLVIPFLVNIFWLKLLLFATFFLFCIFGYLLIKSTLREARQKEILEQKVRERTAELEKSKNVAEDRAKEIERWYHLTVGREIRMAELKDEMKKIKEKKEGNKQ